MWYFVSGGDTIAIIKRILKGVLIWFVAMFVMYLIFSQLFPMGTKMPVLLSLFILIFPIYCAVKFSKLKQKSKKETPLAKNATTEEANPAPRSSTLARIDQMSGHEFEHFTADLLRKLGYERVEVTQGSGDQGVDVIAVKDGKRYAIQCKRYSKKLGNKPAQEVNAGRTIYGCSVAVVLTNNYFTDGAKEAARAVGVELWDRDTLRRMLDYANYKAVV